MCVQENSKVDANKTSMPAKRRILQSTKERPGAASGSSSIMDLESSARSFAAEKSQSKDKAAAAPRTNASTTHVRDDVDDMAVDFCNSIYLFISQSS